MCIRDRSARRGRKGGRGSRRWGTCSPRSSRTRRAPTGLEERRRRAREARRRDSATPRLKITPATPPNPREGRRRRSRRARRTGREYRRRRFRARLGEATRVTPPPLHFRRLSRTKRSARCVYPRTTHPRRRRAGTSSAGRASRVGARKSRSVRCVARPPRRSRSFASRGIETRSARSALFTRRAYRSLP